MIVEDLKAVLHAVPYHSIWVKWWDEESKQESVRFRDLEEFMYDETYDSYVIASIEVYASTLEIEIEVE